MRRIAAAVTLTAAFTPAASAHAEAWDPFPILPPSTSLAIAPALDSTAWNAARTCLVKTRSTGATYYAAIVDVTDEKGSHEPTAANAVPWVDALYRDWKPNGRLDPDKHVLVAIGLANHSVAIHPGTRWTDLGFKQTVIKSTIDASSFAKLARAGDYPQAVCALADAVDDKLAALLAEEGKTVARLKKDIEDLRARAAVATPKFRGLGLNSTWATTETQDLDKAPDKLDAAAQALEGGKLSSAETSVKAASTAVQLAEGAIERITRERAMLAAARVDIEKVLAQIDNGPARDFGPMKAARAKVERCAKEVSEGEAALRGYDPWVATPAPSVCLDLARPAIAQADASHRFRTRTLPFVAGGLALSALGLFIAMRRRTRSAVGTVAHDLLETWGTTVERSASRLLALERDHVLYFSPARPKWTGDSEPLDRRAADAVNRAFLLQAAATELLERAHREFDSAGWLSVKPFEHVAHLLTSETVRFETGEIETRRRVDLPLLRSYEGTATTVLGDLSRAYAEAFEALETVQRATASAATASENATKAADATLDAITARDQLGFRAAHLAELARPLLERREEAQARLGVDPVAGAKRLAEVAAALGAIELRARMGNDAARAGRELLARAHELRARAAALRGEGVRLDEARLSLDERVERAIARVGGSHAAIASGDEPEAAKLIDMVRRSLDDLARDLERTIAARDGIPGAVERMRAARSSLSQRVEPARETLARLEAEHDPDAFRAQSGNVDALTRILPEIDADLSEATRDHAAQRYLAAAARVDAAGDRLAAGETLLAEIASIEEALSAQRASASARIEKLRETTRGAAELSTRRGVSRDCAQVLAGAVDEVRDLEQRSARPRPNWFALERESSALESRLAEATTRAEAGIAAHARAHEAAVALDKRLRSIAYDVEVETRDRPHVASAVATARARLDAYLAALASEGSDGMALERELETQRTTVQWAAQIFRTELEAIAIAERELSAARGRIAQLVGRSFGAGVVADTTRANHQLAQAERAAGKKDWPAVIAAAQQAYAAAVEEERVRDDEARALREARLREAAASSSTSSWGSSSWSSSSSSDSSSSWSSSSSDSSSWSSSSSSSDSSSSSSSSDSGGSSWSSSSDSGGSSW